MVFVANTTLRASPARVLRIGRFVFAITPRAKAAPRRRKPKLLAQSVPGYLHGDVGLPPRQVDRSHSPPGHYPGTMF